MYQGAFYLALALLFRKRNCRSNSLEYWVIVITCILVCQC